MIIVALLLPVSVFAFGGHDGLNCTGCHSLHDAKGNVIFAVAANTKAVNEKTKQPFQNITALCLGCHESPEKGGMGIRPISSHVSHPYGLTKVNDKVAKVPSEFLRDGKFECVGCHDPHPSNPNHKYLRVDTKKGANMEEFCAVCHPMKADPKASNTSIAIFDSMDERSFKKAPANTGAKKMKTTAANQ